jgi:hypothetical protein
MAKKGAGKKSGKGSGERETLVREITIDIDKATYAELGEREGALMRNLDNLKEQFAEVEKSWDERIDPVADELAGVRKTLKEGKITKTAEVEVVKNYDENRVDYVFEGKVVDSRDMTVEDRQGSLLGGQAVEKPKTRRGRDAKQAAANDDTLDEPPRDSEIADVIKMEQGRQTKHTATDGPAGKGHLDRGGEYEDTTSPA